MKTLCLTFAALLLAGIAGAQRLPEPFASGDLYGYWYPESGVIVIAPKFSTAGPMLENKTLGIYTARVSIGEKWGLVDPWGQQILPIAYSMIDPAEDYIRVSAAGKTGLVDYRNQVVVPLQYEDCHHTISSDGLVGVKSGGKWGYLDTSNRIVAIAPEFDRILPFKNEYAKVCVGHKWGVIDHEGCYLLQPAYEQVVVHSATLFSVEVNGRYYCINATGERLCAQSFDSYGELGWWYQESNVVYSDPTNNRSVIVFENGAVEYGPYEEPEVESFSDRFFLGKVSFTGTDGLYGLKEPGGPVYLAPQFDTVYHADTHFARIGQHGQRYEINIRGDKLPIRFVSLSALADAFAAPPSADKPVLYYIFADWCRPCLEVVSPKFNEFVYLYGNRGTYYKIEYNSEEFKQYADRLPIPIGQLPFVILFRNGKYERYLGSTDIPEMLDKLCR